MENIRPINIDCLLFDTMYPTEALACRHNTTSTHKSLWNNHHHHRHHDVDGTSLHLKIKPRFWKQDCAQMEQSHKGLVRFESDSALFNLQDMRTQAESVGDVNVPEFV